MLYAQYQATEAYVQKTAGAGIRIAIYRATDPKPLIASTTGINARDDFETVPIEEAGEDGVNEIVTGRHTGSGSLNGFFTPERNDILPSRQNFLESGNGIEYTILEVTGDRRVGTETNGDAVVLNAYTGVKISSYSHAVGARGVVGFDMAFTYTHRFSGEEWAARGAP